jgi:hypothetical protein
MPDFGGDGISLRGPAGERLKKQQEKDLKEFQDMINDQLKLKEYLNKEKDANGGLVGRGQGKAIKIKTTKLY